MPEDVITSSARPWLKFLQHPILQKFLPTGRRGRYFLNLLVCTLLLPQVPLAQYAAFNSVAVNSFQSNLTWATGISTYDINHDGWDDITAASSQHGVAIYLNTHGDFEYIDALSTIEGNLKTVYWADYDNDADADLLIIRYVANPLLLRNDGNWSFTDVTSNLPIPIYSPLMQSACWADYNNDGWIDVYINNYYQQGDITNWLFHNNGDGTFSEVATIAGVDNGTKPTYQSNWIDFDRDGDQDIYVSNDRNAGNQLYVNQGDGTFLPDSSGIINLHMDAMGVQWHDHDYDGDFDVYISNEIEASVLIENHQGVFIHATDSLQVGCPNHVSWGVQWTDPDNDGLDDLCVIHKDFNNITCHFQRNENLSYTLNAASILSQAPYSSYCLVTGDFNNDGQEDLVQSTVSPQRILVWLANPSTNNSITIGLEGTSSNHDGIGAIIEVHAGNKQLIKQVTCGESYYGQSSQHEIFGLGATNVIDSILIFWPSGWTDVLRNVEVNQALTIQEGSTYIDLPETITLQRCFNEILSLETDATAGVIWDNGDTNSVRMVDAAGLYSCATPGLFNQTHQIIFQVTDFAPAINFTVSPVLCANAASGSITLEALEGLQNILWQTGDSTISLSNIFPGTYTATLNFENGCSTVQTITLENPEPILPWIWSDTICANSTAAILFSSVGGSGIHFWNWFGEDPNAMSAGIHTYSITDEAGCSLVGEFTVEHHQSPIISWSPPSVCIDEATSFAITSNTPIIIEWEAYEEPYALPAGEYPFAFSSGDGCWYDSVYVVSEYEPIYASIIATDSTCAEGYTIFTVDIAAGNAPFTYEWNTGNTDAFASNSGQPVLSCIITDYNGCSIQEELWMNNIVAYSSENILIYPNPTRDLLYINGPVNQDWFLIDATGRVVNRNTTQTNCEHVNLSSLAEGYYQLRIGDNNITVIKQK